MKHHSLAAKPLFVLLVLAALVLVGCGDEGADDTGMEPSIDDLDRPPPDVARRDGPGPDGAPPAPASGVSPGATPPPRTPPGPAPGSGGPGPAGLSDLEKRYVGDGPVVSRTGIKLKLITTKQDCKLYKRPDRSSNSSNAGLFRFFFVLPPDPQVPTRLLESLEERFGGTRTDNHFYRVADADDEEREAGWLHAEDVVEWHHRQVLRLTLRDTRTLPAYFWSDSEKAIAAAKFGSGDPKDRGPTAREPDEGEVDLLLPLLHRRTVQVGRDEQDLYRVAFIGAPADRRGGTRTTPPGSKAPPRNQKEARAQATADIVFVIDTTQSMTHAINEVRRSVAQAAEMVARLPELQGKLRFGLVGYRDTLKGNPQLEYTARVLCTLDEGKDHDHFLRVLANLKTSKISSQGYPEDVLCGLAHALTRDRMGWNDVSHSLIILVGDASAKYVDHPDKQARENETWPIALTGRPLSARDRTVGTLLAIAQPGEDTLKKTGMSQIGFLSILVDHSASVGDEKIRKFLREDLKISKRQYGALAYGRQSGIEGKLLVVQGGDRPHNFSRNLADLMEQQLQGMRQVLRAKEPVKLAKGANAATAPVGFIQLLRSLPGGGTGDFQFARGYCTQLNNKGEEQFDPYYLVKRKDLLRFLGGLNAFLEILKTRGRDGEIVEGLQLISSVLAYAQKIDEHTKLRDILESELGLPVRNKVFRFTPTMLRALPQGEYDEWLAEVHRIRDGLTVVIENQNKWHALKRDSGYGFVAVQELP